MESYKVLIRFKFCPQCHQVQNFPHKKQLTKEQSELNVALNKSRQKSTSIDVSKAFDSTACRAQNLSFIRADEYNVHVH